eukprot:CAMPEP_0195601880 /NCGR_PEP_ID=MMETSP0815-20121206/5314_1 /TAXON_ID=97485 /ORGANISM="Prymnesium parvum, Strain Texoma1" /LENGTH=143 /DNA_ID=CAMNT_0040741437 /DNA_START=28 /DNA_END=461 /DNA_ORIENTATION=+
MREPSAASRFASVASPASSSRIGSTQSPSVAASKAARRPAVDSRSALAMAVLNLINASPVAPPHRRRLHGLAVLTSGGKDDEPAVDAEPLAPRSACVCRISSTMIEAAVAPGAVAARASTACLPYKAASSKGMSSRRGVLVAS